jgi:hypothetical protein
MNPPHNFNFNSNADFVEQPHNPQSVCERVNGGFCTFVMLQPLVYWTPDSFAFEHRAGGCRHEYRYGNSKQLVLSTVLAKCSDQADRKIIDRRLLGATSP